MLFYLYIITATLLLYLSGHIIYSLFHIIINRLYVRVFTKMLIGLVFITIVYSFIKSHGITINLALIPLIVLIGINNKLSIASFKPSDFKEDIRAIPFIMILLSILFAYQYYLIMHTTTGYPAFLNKDDIFNAHAAMYLNYSGTETLNWNYMEHSNSVVPYHYFLFWGIGFFSWIFNQNTYIITELLVNPLLYCLVIIGLWAFCEKYKLNIFIRIFCSLILFFSGIHLPVMDTHPLFNWSVYYFNLFSPDAKSVLYYIVLTASLLFIQHGKPISAFLIFLSLPIISVVLAPTVLIIGTLSIIYYCFRQKKFSLHIFSPVFVGILLLCFYKVFGSDKGNLLPIHLSGISASLLFSVKTFAYKTFSVLLEYSPYLLGLLVAILYKAINLKEVANYLLFIVLGFIISFVAWMVLYNYYGSQEFHSYFIIPVIDILLFALLLFSFTNLQKPGHKVFFLVLTLSPLLYTAIMNIKSNSEQKEVYENHYSVKYLDEVTNEVKDKRVLITASSVVDDIYSLTGNPFEPTIAPYLSTMTPYNIVIRLCPISDSMNSHNFGSTMDGLNPFIKFIDVKKTKGTFISASQIEIDFLKTNKIKYFISGPRPDSILSPYITRQIKDSLSGQTFSVLNF